MPRLPFLAALRGYFLVFALSTIAAAFLLYFGVIERADMLPVVLLCFAPGAVRLYLRRGTGRPGDAKERA